MIPMDGAPPTELQINFLGNFQFLLDSFLLHPIMHTHYSYKKKFYIMKCKYGKGRRRRRRATTFTILSLVEIDNMYAGYKRPGGGSSGALVQVKRPRQDLVVAGGDARSRQLVQSVSSKEYLNNAHHDICTSL